MAPQQFGNFSAVSSWIDMADTGRAYVMGRRKHLVNYLIADSMQYLSMLVWFVLDRLGIYDA